MNEISSKQLYIMIFFIPLVFKMSSLPALFYGETASTAFILIGIVVFVEFLQLALVLFVSREGGMDGIAEKYGKKVYFLISVPIMFVIFVKMLVLTQEIVHYLCGFFFYNISESAIMIIVILVIFYLGTRGAKAIGRLFELSIWFIPLIIIFGAFFGEIELESMYLTPVFDKSASTYLSAIGKYLIFTFDFSPLLYFNVKAKKVTPVAVCTLLSTFAVMISYALLFSSYGNASVHASFGFARLATFNTVISEIGSLDWPSVLLWIVAGILSISLKVNAVNRIFGEIKLKKFGTGLFCLGITLVLLLGIKTLNKAIEFVTNGIQYAVFSVEIAVPLAVLILFAAKHERREYAPQG